MRVAWPPRAACGRIREMSDEVFVTASPVGGTPVTTTLLAKPPSVNEQSAPRQQASRNVNRACAVAIGLWHHDPKGIGG